MNAINFNLNARIIRVKGPKAYIGRTGRIHNREVETNRLQIAWDLTGLTWIKADQIELEEPKTTEPYFETPAPEQIETHDIFFQEKEAEQNQSEQEMTRKPGVIATIFFFINTWKTGISDAQLLENLVEIFPDRNAESMAATIKIQLGTGKSCRMAKERGITIECIGIENAETKKVTYHYKKA